MGVGHTLRLSQAYNHITKLVRRPNEMFDDQALTKEKETRAETAQTMAYSEI